MLGALSTLRKAVLHSKWEAQRGGAYCADAHSRHDHQERPSQKQVGGPAHRHMKTTQGHA